jgi:hypothetical protein
MLAQELADVLADEKIKNNIDIFNAPLPKEWINEAISLTQSVSIRRRKLPPEQV